MSRAADLRGARGAGGLGADGGIEGGAGGSPEGENGTGVDQTGRGAARTRRTLREGKGGQSRPAGAFPGGGSVKSCAGRRGAVATRQHDRGHTKPARDEEVWSTGSVSSGTTVATCIIHD